MSEKKWTGRADGSGPFTERCLHWIRCDEVCALCLKEAAAAALYEALELIVKIARSAPETYGHLPILQGEAALAAARGEGK